jgi:hypothetical protein
LFFAVLIKEGRKYMSADAIQFIGELFNFVDESGLMKEPHSHIRVWFRGHSNEDYILSPGIYRVDAQNENDRLSLERHLSQEFRALAAAHLVGREKDAEVYFLQQHYGMPTRLLDWTTSLLTALWFAVENEDDTHNGKIFMMDAYSMKTNDTYKDFGIASPTNTVLLKALEPIFQWTEVSNFPNFIIPVRPAHNDWRIRQQQSFFTFHVPDASGKEISTKKAALTKSDNPTLKSIIVPKEKKKDIKKVIELLGINAFTVYGDLNNLSKSLVAAYVDRWKARPV